MRGFVMFVIDGEEKRFPAHRAFAPDQLGVAILGLLRDYAGMARASARALKLAGSREAQERHALVLRRLERLVEEDPEDIVRKVFQAGVVVPDDMSLSSSGDIVWGYVVDFDCWGYEVYEGLQNAPHTDGRFFERRLRPSALWYPPRLAAVFGMGDEFDAARALPSDEEFLAAVRDGARTCTWPGADRLPAH